jgi:nicotinate-nucleotide--dimethylbenzimidazole phosphoribosyltransferase
MTAEQMRAAVSAGVEIGAALPGNLAALAGIGVGGFESSAMVLARLTRAPVRELLLSGPRMNPDDLAHLLMIAQGVESRQRVSTDPLEVLAAFGGFEMAMMVGVMLATASRRGLIMVDGLQALAALAVASRLAPAIVDYCVFCRSHRHQGLDRAMALFKASAVLELGLDCTDGTGAALSWPLIRCAAALMSDVVDGEDPGPTLPQPLDVIEQL